MPAPVVGQMKKVILVLALVFVLLIGGVVAAALMSSPDYHVERSVTVAASPETTYNVLVDLQQFKEWSPWEKLDPEMKKEFSGPDTGVGSSYHWSGNSDVGEGKMTITKVEPNKMVEVRLEFIKPFESTCKTTWTVTSTEQGSQVTWAMDGRNEGLVPRIFGLFLNMDSMVGQDFENGLSDLKKVCENKSGGAAEARSPFDPTPAAVPTPTP